MPKLIPESIQKTYADLEAGFLGFWVRKYRISYLIVLALIVLGLGASFAIPKESSPSIKFGTVIISTVFPGANPIDIDSLITEKLYKEIKDIEGAKKITSSSSLGASSISIELQPETEVSKYINDVRNKIGRVSLPKDAKTPNVIEIASQTNQVLSATLYSPNNTVSLEKLRILGADLKEKLELVPNIQKVDYGSVLKYDVRVLIDKEVLKGLGITIADVSNTIRSYHQDAPIGNYGIGERNYDFRIQGKFEETSEILAVPIVVGGGRTIKLGDIVTLERSYDDKSISRIGFPNADARNSVTLTISKNEGAGIFAAASGIKSTIESELLQSKYADVSVAYANDQSDIISDDYAELAHEAVVTLVLVFVVMWMFIGFRDSLFATVTLPLAFLCTFMLLNFFGYSLNFLTNFSLVLSFGIAVDTIIVIVQAASAKIRVGYEPRTAILLALREYGLPITAGVLTTIVAFVPMMVLPGILGKFLAYIPITIFGVLASGLILALTVNSALYLLVIRPKKQFVHDDTAIEYASDEEKALLEFERIGKEEIKSTDIPLRLRWIHAATMWYKRALTTYITSHKMRMTGIFSLFVILILSFVPLIGGKSLAGHVGFNLFPASDNGFVQYVIKGATGERVASLDALTPKVVDILKKYPEIKFYELQTNDSKTSTDAGISISVTMLKLKEREAAGQMSVFDLDKALLKDFDAIRSLGYDVSSKVQEGGPPAGKAVAVKLVANSPQLLADLTATAKDFEKEIRSYDGVKNIENSAGDTPGQFVFELRKDVLSELGIPASVVIEQVTTLINGQNVGTIAARGEDISIVVKYSQFVNDVNPDLLAAHIFKFGGKDYRLGDLINANVTNAVASIKRESGLTTISIGADVEEGILATDVQKKFLDYAAKYPYPNGISYSAGGENQENADLIVAILTAFFIAMIAIFSILTLQFNSFKQPIIVLFSVIMSLPFVFLGLLITGNQMSLPFGIGFIAFTGIAVNHGIILIDAININLGKGMKSYTALVEAGSSRLEPMILTTLTTCLGILPLALRDAFWSALGFTIIFGLMACTFITLFVVKGLYYEVFMVEHHWMRSFFRFMTWPVRFVWNMVFGPKRTAKR